MGTLLNGCSIKHWQVSARLSSGLKVMTAVVMKDSTVSLYNSVGVPVIKWYAISKRSFSEIIPTSNIFFSTTGRPVILCFAISSRASVTSVSLLTTMRSFCIMFFIFSILLVLLMGLCVFTATVRRKHSESLSVFGDKGRQL